MLVACFVGHFIIQASLKNNEKMKEAIFNDDLESLCGSVY